MLATIATALVLLLPAAMLCLGVMGTLIGAVAAVLAMPDAPPVEIPARPAGLILASLSLLVFIVAALWILDLVPHA